jgi:hypothetical protein
MNRRLLAERHLFIVSRDAPEVARFLTEQFPPDSNVSVVVDRRHGQRRSVCSPTATERRSGERRQRADVEQELRLRSHAFVTLRVD